MRAHFLLFCAFIFVDASATESEDVVRYRPEIQRNTSAKNSLRGVNSSPPFSLEDRNIRRNASYYSEDQLTTPVPEDDFWWYFTTSRRPFFSARDFPGKPGVAVWKEILPGVTNERRKDKKLAQPTAACVTNRATGETRKGTIILSILVLFGFHEHFFWFSALRIRHFDPLWLHTHLRRVNSSRVKKGGKLRTRIFTRITNFFPENSWLFPEWLNQKHKQLYKCS